MLIASRAAATAVGILGGSGNHVIQIVIVSAVAIVLIGYFLLGIARRGGGGVHTATAAVSQHDREHEGAGGDATVRLVRMSTGIGIGPQSEQWNIAIDGVVVSSIANKETVEVAVAPGHHTLRLGSGRRRSGERSFDVAEDEVVGFRVHGPRILPMLVAALVNPDLWISLGPE